MTLCGDSRAAVHLAPPCLRGKYMTERIVPVNRVDFLVTDYKVRLYPAVTIAAEAVKLSATWTRDDGDMSAVFGAMEHQRAELERHAEQISFFGSEMVNDALNALIGGAEEFTGAIGKIYAGGQRIGKTATGGVLPADHRRALRRYDERITAFVVAAREDLGITSRWRPVRRFSTEPK